MNENGALSEGRLPSRCPIGGRDGVFIELLLIGGQREENGLKERTE